MRRGVSMPAVGETAPDFALRSDEGRRMSLKDFRGNLARVASKGAVVLGVSRDDAASHGKFRDKYHLNFPLLSDDEGKVTEAYGVWKKKNLYGREHFGIERTTFLIDEDGKIARVWPKVHVEGHTDEVLAAL